MRKAPTPSAGSFASRRAGGRPSPGPSPCLRFPMPRSVVPSAQLACGLRRRVELFALLRERGAQRVSLELPVRGEVEHQVLAVAVAEGPVLVVAVGPGQIARVEPHAPGRAEFVERMRLRGLAGP